MTPTIDRRQVIRMSSRPARMLMIVFAAANFIYTFTALDQMKHPVPSLLAAVLVGLGAALLTLDRPDPYPLALTLAVLAVVVVSTLLIDSQLPLGELPRRGVWHLGSNTWLLFFLAMRRRVAWAWLGFVAMFGVTSLWAIESGRGVLHAVNSMDSHAAILLVASLFNLSVRNAVRALEVIDQRAMDLTVESANAQAAAQIRSQRAIELQRSAVPLLQRILDKGAPADDAERAEYAVTEAALRDSVRGRSLATPQIAQAAAQARYRGVEVNLLDDRGEALASGEAMERLNAAVVAALGAASGGTVTVRLAPKGRATAVSIVSVSDGGASRVELDDLGEPIGALNQGR